MVGKILARGHIPHFVFVPIRSARRDAVRQVAAVFRRRGHGQRHGAIFGEGVRVDEHFRLAVAHLFVEDGLVLESVVPEVERHVAAFEGRAEFLVIPKLGEARFNGVAVFQGFQIGEGDGVLRLDPGLGGVRVRVFQAAPRIGDLSAVEIIDHVGFREFRVLELGVALARGEGKEHEDGETHLKDNFKLLIINDLAYKLHRSLHNFKCTILNVELREVK